MLMVFLGMVGLAIDMEYGLLAGQQLQTAADAAALAGAQCVWLDETGAEARASAISVAHANKAAGSDVILQDNPGNAPNGDVLIGRWDSEKQTFTATTVHPNAVQVNARRTSTAGGGPVALLFGPMFGVKSIDIQRQATAVIQYNGYGAIFLNRSASPGVLYQGNVTFETFNGNVMVNSNSNNAIQTHGNPNIFVPEFHTPGGTGNARLPNSVVVKDDPVPDPLASVPEINVNTLIQQGMKPEQTPAAGSTIYESTRFQGSYHYFPNGLNGTFTLTPGIYIVGGSNALGGSLTGTGVMFFVMSGGQISLGGNDAIDITPPEKGQFAAADTYYGISIWQARGNSKEVSFHGTPDVNIRGIIYTPDAEIYARGDISCLGNQLIAASGDFGGNNSITIEYRGRDDADAHQSYLVK